MPVLVLFARSLNMDHRKFVTYLARIALVFVVLITLIAAHARSFAAGVGAPGLWFFAGVAYVTLVFISLAGIFFFSSAITEEKEQMTL